MNEALAILDTLPALPIDSPINLVWLKCDCLTAKSQALNSLGLYEESYAVANDAAKLVSPDDRGVFGKQYPILPVVVVAAHPSLCRERRSQFLEKPSMVPLCQGPSYVVFGSAPHGSRARGDSLRS